MIPRHPDPCRATPLRSAGGEGGRGPGSGPVGGGAWFADDDAHRRQADNRGPGPDGQSAEDRRIEEETRRALAGEDSLKAADISVTVSEAFVTLDGVVATPADKRLAERHAAGVSSADKVRNKLRVEEPGRD